MKASKSDNDFRNSHNRWRTEDVQYINNNMDADVSHLAVKFGRTKGAIRAIKHKLKQKNHEQYTRQIQRIHTDD